MNYQEFAGTIRKKYPGSYDSIDDKTLAEKVVSKYPVYAGKVTFDEVVQQPEEMSLSGLGENIKEDIPRQLGKLGEGALGLAKTSFMAPMEPARMLFGTAKDLYQGRDFQDTPIGQAPGQLVDFAKSVPGALVENIKQPYERPVGAAIDVASMATPFLKTSRVAPLLSKAEAVPSLFKRYAAKGLSLFGPDEEALLARMKNPEAIKTAGTVADVTNTFPKIAEKFNTVISSLSDEANKVISKSTDLAQGAISKDDVIGAANKARKNLGGIYTDEARTASKVLERVTDKFKRVRGSVSQNQVKTIIGDLDNEIPWDKVWRSPESLTASDRALIDIRTNLDSVLKVRNPQYAELMGPVSDAINSRKEFLKKFGVEKVKGQGYQLQDTAINRVSRALDEDKVASQRILGDVKQTIGEDIVSKLENAKFKEEFQPPTSSTLSDKLRFSPQTIINVLQNKFGRQMAGQVADVLSKELPTKGAIAKTGALFGASEKLGGLSEKAKDASSTRILKKRVLDKKKAAEYLDKAGGDPEKALELAEADGY